MLLISNLFLSPDFFCSEIAGQKNVALVGEFKLESFICHVNFSMFLIISGLYRLLHGYEDKSAYALCQFAYFSGKKGDEVKLFTGKTNGVIVEPRGPRTFGWDPVFQPEGFEKTYAELPKEIKNTISHRYKALDQVRAYFMKQAAKEKMAKMSSE